MKILKVLPAATFVLLLAASSASFASDTTTALPGNVTLAKSGAHSLLVWDASPVVSALTSAKKSHEEALAQLESDAVSIAASHAAELSAAEDITVRVVYMKMGAVDPAYGAPTLAGVEKLFTVQASRGNLASQEAAWTAQLNAQKVPSGVTLSVTGQLPPV